MKLVAQRISRLPLAVWCAIFFGLVAGILTIAAPGWQLERGVHALRLDLISSAAAPPLGQKARLALALLAGGLVGLLILLPYALWRLVKPRHIGRPFSDKPIIVARQLKPTEVRGGEPETISRRPIFADLELGAPLMSEGALAHASVFDQLHDDVHPDFPPVASPDWSENVPAPEAPIHPAMALPLNEMIARLERGLSNRTTEPTPPSPHASSPLPLGSRVEPLPIATPLSVVPRSAPPEDAERGQSSDLLQEAMSKLSVLVGHQR